MRGACFKTFNCAAATMLILISGMAGPLRIRGTTEFPLTHSIAQHDSSLVQVIIGNGYLQEDRLKAVRLLGSNLKPEAISSLYFFLIARPDSTEEIGEIRLIKNNVMDVLIEQAIAPPRIVETLIEISRDIDQDKVVRDYAIQHLVACYNAIPGVAEGVKEQIGAVLLETAGANNSRAGTALIGLHRLSSQNFRFQKNEIDALALHWAQCSSCDIATRITAIQICGERQLKAVLPTVRMLAKNGNNFSLQTAAIASLGCLGERQDAASLKQMASEGDLELRPAIDAALKRLQHHSELQ
jgi:hypothetical protein